MIQVNTNERTPEDRALSAVKNPVWEKALVVVCGDAVQGHEAIIEKKRSGWVGEQRILARRENN